jgi:hypothetical protein
MRAWRVAQALVRGAALVRAGDDACGSWRIAGTWGMGAGWGGGWGSFSYLALKCIVDCQCLAATCHLTRVGAPGPGFGSRRWRVARRRALKNY